MKYPLCYTALLTAIGWSLCAQEIVLADDYSYTTVIEAPGKSQSDIYNAMHGWIFDQYNSARDVIQREDRESATILARGIWILASNAWTTHEVQHDIRMEARDGRYRITFSNWMIQSVNGGLITLDDLMKGARKKRIQAITERIAERLQDLSQHITAPVDDW